MTLNDGTEYQLGVGYRGYLSDTYSRGHKVNESVNGVTDVDGGDGSTARAFYIAAKHCLRLATKLQIKLNGLPP